MQFFFLSKMKFFASAVICVTNLFLFAETYKILAVAPLLSQSHYAFIDPLLVKLAELGHEVDVYSPFPKTRIIENYAEYDTGNCSISKSTHHVSMDDMYSLMRYKFLAMYIFFSFATAKAETIVQCAPLYELLKSSKTYDLFITESFSSDVLLLYANKFRTPVITYVPTGTLFPWLASRLQNPQNPSYVPELVSGILGRMSFLERVENSLLYVYSSLLYNFLVLRKDNEVNERLLGPSARSLYDTVKNTSLLFYNAHHSTSAVIPQVPGLIAVGGIHIKSAAALPKDIEKFINESEHGVVYFCMGSLLRGETFPEEKRNAFLYAFSKIPQRVLWKWEGDVLPGKPDNVMIAKWMPQRDILAHPNIKLFISHGGLLGTSEAVYEGVPILGIPIFGDQRTNIKAIEANGAGELLDYNEISNEVVLEKIQKLTTDPNYKENARQLSERFKDRPMSPLDTAVYWTEYVIRHKGAPHLKTAAVDMPWYQYLLLDVIAFLILVFVSAILILYYSVKIIVKIIFNLVCGKKSSSKLTKKEKRS